jgi:hypothetical protein
VMIIADQSTMAVEFSTSSGGREAPSGSSVIHLAQARAPFGGVYRPVPIIRPMPLIPPVPRLEPPKIVVIPPPSPRCQNHPCARMQQYQIETCRGGKCKKEWKHRCVAGVICR